MQIEINKNIDQYQESVIMGLTLKQFLYSILSLVVGGALVLLLYSLIGLTLAAYVTIPVVAPIAMTGFYSYQGMSFMEVMKCKFYFMFSNKPLVYESTEKEEVLEQQKSEKGRRTNEGKTIFRRVQRVKKGK